MEKKTTGLLSNISSGSNEWDEWEIDKAEQHENSQT